MKKCNIPGCGRPVASRGLCQAHYHRRRKGLPMRAPIAPKMCGPASERLKAYVEVDPMTGCHLWTGRRDLSGYGRMTVGGKKVGVHRLAWELAKGPIPDGLFVLHDCDNRRCCNPEHLSLGTAADNARDRAERRRTKGCRERDLERHPQWGDPFGALPREGSRRRLEVSPLRPAAPRPDRVRSRVREKPG